MMKPAKNTTRQRRLLKLTQSSHSLSFRSPITDKKPRRFLPLSSYDSRSKPQPIYLKWTGFGLNHSRGHVMFTHRTYNTEHGELARQNQIKKIAGVMREEVGLLVARSEPGPRLPAIGNTRSVGYHRGV